MPFDGKFEPRRPSLEAKSDPKFEQTFKNARELLSANEFKMGQFADHYTPDAIRADATRLKETERKILEDHLSLSPEERRRDTENYKRSVICEAGIFRGIREQKWLGEYAHVKKTSRYDDVVNGVDLSVQFTGRGGTTNTGFTMDGARGHRYLEKKFNRIHDDIWSDKLSTIKYFRDVRGSFVGALHNIPRVVVGFDAERIERIMRLWNEGDRSSPNEPFLHDGMLYEIQLQLKQFAAFARKLKKEHAAYAYEHNLATIDRIIGQRKLPTRIEELEEDQVFREIKENLARFS